MKMSQNTKHSAPRWAMAIAVIALAVAAALVPAYQAGRKTGTQEKSAAQASVAEQSTSQSDQTDLAVTVYNSNIALVRDVRQLQ